MTQARGRNPLRSVMDGGQAKKRSRFAIVAEVFGELTKVTWPSREDATRLSILVIGVSAVVGLILAAWDLGFSEVVERLFL